MSEPTPQLSPESELVRIENLLATGPPTLDLLFCRAAHFHMLGRLEEAKHTFQAILKLDSKHLGRLGNIGNNLYKKNARMDPHAVYAHIILETQVNLAKILVDLNDHTGARHHYEIALRMDPQCFEAHQGMAAIMMELGEEDAAWEHGKKGFSKSAAYTIPCRGSSNPVSLLVLNSMAGGNIPLGKVIDSQIFTVTMLTTEFYNPASPLPAHHLVWNAIGDADRCPQALEMATVLLSKTDVPVLNTPASVARTGRAENAPRFSEIKGVIVPKTLPITKAALGQSDALAMLEASGFAFPFLLRAVGFHEGKHFVKLHSKGELSTALLAMPGWEFAVIQFLDARDSDGRCRKYRVMSIGGKLYPLHAAISKNWKIHYYTADMAENSAHRAEDLAFLSDMPHVLGSTAMNALEKISNTLGLDYAGIDFSLNAKGEILFFEANATMSIAQPPAGEKWAYRRAPVQKAVDAVTAMLLSKSNQQGDLHHMRSPDAPSLEIPG